MSYIEKVPKHAAKAQLPGLKVGALVKTIKADYWEGKNFEEGFLPAGSIGRVRKIYDFGPVAGRGGRRFYCSVKFGRGIPVTTFYTEELARVRI